MVRGHRFFDTFHLNFALVTHDRLALKSSVGLEVAAMICPYCDAEYTAEHPCLCQPKMAAAHPEKFTLVPPPEKQKGTEHPPTGLKNPIWN